MQKKKRRRKKKKPRTPSPESPSTTDPGSSSSSNSSSSGSSDEDGGDLAEARKATKQKLRAEAAKAERREAQVAAQIADVVKQSKKDEMRTEMQRVSGEILSHFVGLSMVHRQHTVQPPLPRLFRGAHETSVANMEKGLLEDPEAQKNTMVLEFAFLNAGLTPQTWDPQDEDSYRMATKDETIQLMNRMQTKQYRDAKDAPLKVGVQHVVAFRIGGNTCGVAMERVTALDPDTADLIPMIKSEVCASRKG